MHKINFGNKKKVIVVIGCGGTGSYIIGNLARQDYVPFLIDGDVVEEKNLKRQEFFENDINKYKSQVFGERYSLPYSTEFLDTAEDLAPLFDEEPCVPVIISAVDNNGTRALIDEMFHMEKYPDFVYIGSGNGKRNGQVYVALKKDGEIIYETEVVLDKALQATDGENRRPTQISCAEHANSSERGAAQTILANVTAGCLVSNLATNVLNDGILTGNKFSFDCNFMNFKVETVTPQD